MWSAKAAVLPEPVPAAACCRTRPPPRRGAVALPQTKRDGDSPDGPRPRPRLLLAAATEMEMTGGGRDLKCKDWSSNARGIHLTAGERVVRHQGLAQRAADGAHRVFLLTTISGAAAVQEDERHVPTQAHLVVDVRQPLGLARRRPRRTDQLCFAPPNGEGERHDAQAAPLF
ncbi:hypothetical protein EJB05_14759, partial [Eragrostis curvula]